LSRENGDKPGTTFHHGLIAAIRHHIPDVAADVELRRNMGCHGRELCRTAFDWHNMVEGLEGLYARLLQDNAAPVAQVDRASDF
jgi:hypothetical protein